MSWPTRPAKLPQINLPGVMNNVQSPLRTLLACIIASMLLTSLAALAQETQVSISTVDGASLTGHLTDWDTKGLTLSIKGQSTKITAEQLLALHMQPSSTTPKTLSAHLEMVDGTLLPLTDYTVADRLATVGTPLAKQPLTMPIEKIRFVQLTSSTTKVAKLWNDVAGKPLEGDLLFVHKKQQTTLDYLTGTLGDISDAQVTFSWEGDPIPVNRSKVAALAYFHARLPKRSEALGWLKTRDGALLPIASVTLNEETLELTTIGGLQLQLPLESLLEADYSRSKLVYLSDMQPLRQTWTPRIELPASAKLILQHGLPRKDQSFASSTLTLRWPPSTKVSSRSSQAPGEIKMYHKGLALRSRTELEYRLPPKAKRFAAIAGIDPATADQGNVQLEIAAEDQILWQGEIDGSAPPTEIQVDLNGAQRLRILVDYGTNLDFGDRLHLVEARVTK